MTLVTRDKTILKIGSDPGVAWVCKWEGLDSDDDGDELEMPAWSDRSVQVIGTFGSGGSLSFYGSNDGTNFVILNDLEGAALTFTAAGLRSVMEITRYVKPLVTAGDGTTDLDVYLMLSGYRRW